MRGRGLGAFPRLAGETCEPKGGGDHVYSDELMVGNDARFERNLGRKLFKHVILLYLLVI